jgi:sec-independent protein translocase protein TatC
MEPGGPDESQEKRMPISEHLIELRRRLIISIIAAVAGAIVAYAFCPGVFFPLVRAPLDSIQGAASDNPYVLRTPLLRAVGRYYQSRVARDDTQPTGPPNRLHVMSLTEAFIMRLKVALVVGIFLGLPVILWQVWAFVSAGLHRHERKYVLRYAPVSFFLFIFGASLAYFVVLPLGIVFLLAQGRAMGVHELLNVSRYAPLVMWLMLGFGVVFQMPLVILFLTRLGVVTPDALARSRRWAVLIMVVVAAMTTPPDPFTQIAIALPMLGLYEVSILLSRYAARRKPAPDEPE